MGTVSGLYNVAIGFGVRIRVSNRVRFRIFVYIFEKLNLINLIQIINI